MKIIRGQLFIYLIIYFCDSSNALDAAYDAGKEIWKLYSMIDKITSHTSDDGNSDNIPMNQEIRNQMNQIYKELDEMDKTIGHKIIHDSFQSWTSNVLIYKYIDTLELFVSSVDEYAHRFFQRINQTSYHSETLQEVMESVLPHIVDNIIVIRKNMMDASQLLLTQYNLCSQHNFCNGPQIISDALVRLFRIVIVAELKVHTMFAMAAIYPLPLSAGKVGWGNVITREQFERQFGLYVNIFALNLQLAEPVYLRACDPVGGKWIRDKSFYELEGTFQTAIFAYNVATCSQDSCNDVWSKKAQKCRAEYYDVQSGCSAALTECRWLEDMRACVLKSGPKKFQYINSTRLGLLGRASRCTSDLGWLIEEGSDWDRSHTACICNCSRNHNKISINMVESQMRLNKVVTGLRFVRQKQILHIQPKEGKLSAHGYIDPDSERWVPLPEDLQASQISSVEKTRRAFFFDDLQLPAGYVLIGVKFTEVIRGVVKGFAIEIYGVPFEYESGRLNYVEEFMASRLAPHEDPGQPMTFEPRSSVFTTKPHTINPKNRKYVLLERSDLQDDVGQSTLPFFDAVPIYPKPSSALGGVGIFHKGVEGFAGFISLRVYGMKYAENFRDFESKCMEGDRVLFNHSKCFP